MAMPARLLTRRLAAKPAIKKAAKAAAKKPGRPKLHVDESDASDTPGTVLAVVEVPARELPEAPPDGPLQGDRRRRPMGVDTPFSAFVRERTGRPIYMHEKEMRYGASVLQKLSATPEGVSPNSPMLRFVAEQLGVPLADVQAFATRAPMAEPWVNKIAHQIKNAAARGDAPRRKVGRPLGTSTNKVRKGRLDVRQVARSLVMTVNIAAMNGEKELPPLPITDLRALLEDYLIAKGIKDVMLVSPNFADQFD